MIPPEPPAAVRLDKWLWAVRLYKTRTLAADACRLGRVTSGGGEPVKPSSAARPGDVLAVRQEFLTRRVRVKAVLEKRVAAKLVADYLDDVTPPEEIEAARMRRESNALAGPVTPPGFGRPTKAQRRAMEVWSRLNEGRDGDG